MLKNKRLFKSIAILAIIVFSMFMLTGCEFGSKKEEEKKKEAYEEPISNLVKGLEEANSQKFLSAFPSFISDYVKDVFTDDYMKEVLNQSKETYGENLTMNYTVTKIEDISKENLESQQQQIKELYGKEITISNGKKVEVEIVTKGDAKEDKDTDSFEVYEIDGKWCIIDFN